MDHITIKMLPLSGVVHVFDITTGKTIFKGTEDTIPERISRQQPKRVYCCEDIIYIDVEYQRMFYDTEANWFYYESYFKSLFDEYTEEHKKEFYNNSFDLFLQLTLECEPVIELKTDEDEKEIKN